MFHYYIDPKWTAFGRVLSQIDSGMTPAIWAVDPNDYIWLRINGKWRKVPGKLIHVSSGGAGIWGVARNNRIYTRVGVGGRNLKGKSWKRISGGLKQIDSGPPGIVCGVNKNDDIYCRTGVVPANRFGRSWVKVPGKLKYISCGAFGHWGVNKGNNIYFRYGVSPGRPQGTKWKHVPGKLHQIESGPDGAVWGVNLYTGVYTRLGISKGNPIGTRWRRFKKKKLVSISVGLGTLYGIDRKAKPWSSVATILAGPKALPKKGTVAGMCKTFMWKVLASAIGNRDLQIYNATSSTTGFWKKEISHARQNL